MSTRTESARAYFEAFARTDRDAILALLTDDVVWDIHGHRHLRGKDAFAGEIRGEGFEGSPDLEVERYLDAGDAVVVPHNGRQTTSDGDIFTFAACDVLTFEGDLIARVESYVVPLGRPLVG